MLRKHEGMQRNTHCDHCAVERGETGKDGTTIETTVLWKQFLRLQYFKLERNHCAVVSVGPHPREQTVTTVLWTLVRTSWAATTVLWKLAMAPFAVTTVLWTLVRNSRAATTVLWKLAIAPSAVTTVLWKQFLQNFVTQRSAHTKNVTTVLWKLGTSWTRAVCHGSDKTCNLLVNQRTRASNRQAGDATGSLLF